ncbi:MAG TPA: chorismate synthase [bacterium]|nr:chorismate synthase [bacterium]
MPLRFLTAGESHGPELTAILDGLPAGVPLTAETINRDLSRRQLGIGRGGRMRIEQDEVQITGGVRFGETIGSPVSLRLINRDWFNWQERMQVEPLADGQERPAPVTLVRPGHIDLAGTVKLGRADVRDSLERASARETAMRVAVGACCKALLAAVGITVFGRVTQYGPLHLPYPTLLPTAQEVRAGTDLAAEADAILEAHREAMAAEVERARGEGTTLGGAFQVLGLGVPLGLGHFGQWDRRLDGRIAQALMSIPTVKAVAIGAGTDLAGLTGQESNDELFIVPPDQRVPGGPWWYRETNQMGGLEGGVTNGEPVIATCYLKPISTQIRPLRSIDLAAGEAAEALVERSDTAVIEAATVVGEAMLAYVLAEALLEKFGGDNLPDLIAAVEWYRGRVLTVPGSSPTRRRGN